MVTGIKLRLVVVALAVVMAAVSARAAIVAIDVAARRATPPSTPTGYEARDHFPGAALLYAADDAAPPLPDPVTPVAAPAAGVTGTAPLPALPIPAVAGAIADLAGTIHPAPPFSMARASGGDFGRALNCLTTAIYYEAASEPDAGQRAVAQVILNRVRHPAFPATVCGVVYQGSEHAGCQFSFACDGAMRRPPSRSGWARALHTASLMLGGAVEAQVGTATHYHTYAVTPAWNRQMVMTAAIGAHFFHRWQGYWGTPGALAQRYQGGEPLPGPHARLAPLPMPAPLIAAAAPTPIRVASVTLPEAIQPAYAEASTAKAPPPRTDTLPDSQILDKWKDSGKPLR